MNTADPILDTQGEERSDRTRRNDAREDNFNLNFVGLWGRPRAFDYERCYNTVKTHPISFSQAEKIFDIVIGLSLPLPAFDRYISTFHRNDVQAVETDWKSTAHDLARSILLVLGKQDENFHKDFYSRLLQAYVDELFERIEKTRHERATESVNQLKQLSLPFSEPAHEREKG